jgi:hypothetical protein
MFDAEVKPDVINYNSVAGSKAEAGMPGKPPRVASLKASGWFFWDINLIYLFILFFFRESLSTNSIGCSSCCWTSCACMGWALIV